jgi:uncharacterized protein
MSRATRMGLGLALMLFPPSFALMAADFTPADIQRTVSTGRAYALVFLKAGPRRSRAKDEADALQLAHLKHLLTLRAEGKIAIVGPLTDDGDLRGLAIYNATVEEARRLAEADPAVQAGSLVVEAHPWFGLPGDTLPATDPQALHDRRMDYIEFVAPDLEAAKKFYGEVFGWKFTDYGPAYTSFADGRLAGGFRKGAKPAATHPLVVVFARDLETIEARVKAAGGKITTATHAFPGGRRFHFSDPNGLELAVWTDRATDGKKIG